jgi:type III secretory pathway component EscT
MRLMPIKKILGLIIIMSCVKFILKHYILKLKKNNIHNFITLKAFFFDRRTLKAL